MVPARREPMDANDSPVYNHVALTMPKELLQEPKRTDLIEFYQKVYGWEPSPTMMVDGRRLVRLFVNRRVIYWARGLP